MLLSDAAAHLGVPFTTERQFRNVSELDETRHFERGSGAPPFNSFWYVSVLRKAPVGWKASANTPLTLPEFIGMCEHLSNKDNWTSSNHAIAANFKKYTGKSLNPRSVGLAFRDRTLYSSKYLQELMSERLKSAKPRCLGIRSARLNEYARRNPGWCVQHGVELRFSTYHSSSCGCKKDEKINADRRSASCDNVYRHLNRARHPELFEEDDTDTAKLPCLSTSPDNPDKIVSSVKEDIMKKINKSGGYDVLRHPSMAGHFALLRTRKIHLLDIGSGKHLRVCSNCGRHEVIRKQINNSTTCRSCRLKINSQRQVEEKRTLNREARVDPKSTVPLAALNQDELTERVRKLNFNRKSSQKTIARLKNKIKNAKIVVKMSDETVATLEKKLKEAQEKPTQLRETITEALKEMLNEEGQSDQNIDALLTDKDTTELVDFILLSLKNHSIKKLGKKNYSFSPYLMGLTMNQYLQGPKAYDRFQEDAVFVCPSSSTLKRKKNEQHVRAGDSVELYERMALFMTTEEMIGQLICDEMKLKGDIAFNVATDEMRGFTEDFADIKKILTKLLDEDTVESFSKPATYVNQWRFRSVNGNTYNLEFWYNSGSLKGEELLYQFRQVVMRCESVGARVLGMVCDAGGNNARLYKLLAGATSLPKTGWIPSKCVRIVNPWDTSRCIYTFHYSTHDIKVMRNQFFTSWFGIGIFSQHR